MFKFQDSCNEAHLQGTGDSPPPIDSGLVVNENPIHPKTETENGYLSENVNVLSELFERLFHLNKKLEIQEDDIFHLTLQMESILTQANGGKQKLSPEQESVLHNELQIAQEELETMSKLNSRLGYEIKRNELALTNMMQNYSGREKFAERLENDMILDVERQQFTQRLENDMKLHDSDNPSFPVLQGMSRLTYLKKIEEEIESDDDDDSEVDEMTRGRNECSVVGTMSRETRGLEHNLPPYPVLAPPE